MKRLTVSLFAALCTLAASALHLAVLSDVHVTPGNRCDSMLRVAVAEINSLPYDYIIINGDLTNEGSDEQLANVKSILDGLRHPSALVPGNHENNWSQSATKTFIDLWGADRFVVETDSLIMIGLNCGPFMKMGDGHVKQEDLHWLHDQLEKYAQTGKNVLSFNHYPLLEGDLDNWTDYVKVLEPYRVIGQIAGHYHSWRQYKAGDIDAAIIRALDMRNGNFGYTVVDVDADSVKVYDKRLGERPELKFSWAVRTEHEPLDVPMLEMPESPAGFNVSLVWADSASVFTRVAVDADNVYFGNSLGMARAVDKRSGRLKWQVPTSAAIFARPAVVADSRVTFPCSDGIIVADASSGVVANVIATDGVPYVADGVVVGDNYLQGGYKCFKAFGADGLAVKWSYDSLFNYCQASPTVDGDDVVFGAWDTNLRCLSLADGHLKWVWNNGKSANMLGPGNVVPVVSGERIYIVAPDRFMTAIDRVTGQTLWRDNSHRYRESLGHSADGRRIYAKTMDGELVCVDASEPDFKELWTLDLKLGYDHAPCIVLEHDGVVYVGSRRGLVTAVDPESQCVIWQLALGRSEVNGFEVDMTTGDVYLSLTEGRIWRISRTN